MQIVQQPGQPRLVDTRLGKIETRLGHVEIQVTEQGVEIRRHFDVVAEQLRSDIRTFADSVAAGERRLAAISIENTTLLSASSDHELRLRVLEGQSGQASRPLAAATATAAFSTERVTFRRVVEHSATGRG